MSGEKRSQLSWRWRAASAAVAVLLSVAFAGAAQAQYTVTNNSDSGAGSLRAAITAANAAGSASTITFSAGYAANATITLASELPVITANVTINGNGFNPIISGNNTYRPFLIGDAGQNTSGGGTDANTYAVTLSNLTVSSGKAQGGSGGSGGAGLGGAIFVSSNGALTLQNVALSNNNANGGGGSLSASSGGMGGSGAASAFPGGGGGLFVASSSTGGNGGGPNGGAYNASTSPNAVGGAGGFASGGGAASGSGSQTAIGGAGGFGGGGGGATSDGTASGGSGGYGGGGGGTNSGGVGVGGNGGFGGGGGGTFSAGSLTPGTGGFGAGNGSTSAGGGGLGAGGAVFVQTGGTLAISGTLNINGNNVTAGAGGNSGSAFGSGIFFQSTDGTPSTLTLGSGTQTIGDIIADYSGSGGTNPTGGSNVANQGGSLALAKAGTGVLTLSATNTYSGGTTVSGGGLINFNAAGNFGSNTITLNGGGLQWATGTTTDVSPQLNAIGAGGATFDYNGNAVTLGTQLTGIGGVTVANSTAGGSLTFSAAEGYAGATTINAGATLALSGNGDISSSSGVTANGVFDISQTVGGTSVATLAGSGMVALGSSSTGLTISNGSTEFSGQLVDGGIGGGTGGRLEIASGAQTLSGVSTFTGTAQVDSGATLALKGGGSIASALYVAFANGGGTLDISQTSAGASVGGLYDPTGGSKVSLGAQTLTITNGAGPFNGVIQDGGIGGGTGGGVTIAGSGPQTFNNTNTYTGLTTINQNAALDLSGGGDHPGSIATSSAVINNGVFDISGLTNGATSIKSLSGSNTGTVFLGADTLTLTSASGTFAGTLVDGGANGGAGGSLALTGGKEILTGTSTYTGATTVTGATLEVDGSILNSSSVTITAGGTLTGTGTVDPLTVSFASGSTFTPGTAGVPGTFITIAGNLALAGGSTYQIYLDPTTSTYANVTGAAALGGTVAASFASGSYISKVYTILSAASVTGTFGSLTTTNLPSNFTASLSYGAANAYLDLALNYTPPPTPTAPAYTALNTNQNNVANALTNYFNTTGGIPTVFGTLGPAGLTQVDGEAATGAADGAFKLMDQFLNLMLDPFVDGRSGTGWPGGSGGPAMGFAPNQQASFPPDVALGYAGVLKAPPKPQSFEQRWSAWGGAFGGSNTTNGNAAAGSNTVTARDYGYAGGLDYHFSPDTVAGFALAGGGTNWGLAGGLGGGRSDTFQAGVYGATRSGPAYVAAALAFANHWMSTNRIALGDQLDARFSGQSYAGRIEAGYRYAALPTVGVTPYAALQSQSFHTPNYSETDLTGGGFALGYNAMTATDTRSELGARFDDTTIMNGMPLALRARLAWAHDWITNPALAAVFQSLPGASFIVNGATPPKNSALASAGAELHLTANWSATAKFDGEFASGSQTYAGTGTLRYTW